MTITGKLERLCFENGLWPNEAESVLEAFYNESDDELKSRLSDDVEDYPPQLLAVLWIGVKRCAVTYIEANAPMHWAKPMFDGTAENLVK